MTTSNLDIALQKIKQGYSIIPVGADKRPLFEWGEFQDRLATEGEMRKWYQKFPNAGVAVITGWNGLVILDLDVKIENEKGEMIIDEKKKELADRIVADLIDKTLVVKSKSGGYHVYFQSEEPVPFQAFQLGEIRSDRKHYTLIPPSVGYMYLNELPILGVPNAFDVISGLLRKHGITIEQKQEGRALYKEYDKGEKIPAGGRHDYFVSRAGFMRRQGDGVEAIYAQLSALNTSGRLQEPLPEQEVRNIANSMATYEAGKPYVPNPPPKVEAKKIAVTLEELFSMEFPPAEYIVKGIVPIAGKTLIAGDGATYKSFFVLELLRNIVGGKNIVGMFETKQSKVLLVDKENRLPRIQRRLTHMGVDSNYEDFHIISGVPITFDKKEHSAELLKYCLEKGITVIVFDSLVRFFGELEENSADSMKIVDERLSTFCNAGIAVIMLHHSNKSFSDQPSQRNIRGSSDLFNMADSVLAIRRNNRDAMITITHLKNRDEDELKPFVLTIESDNLTRFAFQYSKQNTDNVVSVYDRIKDRALTILLESETSVYKNDLTDLLMREVNGATVRGVATCLKELVESKTIEMRFGKKKDGEKQGVYYFVNTDKQKLLKIEEEMFITVKEVFDNSI